MDAEEFVSWTRPCEFLHISKQIPLLVKTSRTDSTANSDMHIYELGSNGPYHDSRGGQIGSIGGVSVNASGSDEWFNNLLQHEVFHHCPICMMF